MKISRILNVFLPIAVLVATVFSISAPLYPAKAQTVQTAPYMSSRWQDFATTTIGTVNVFHAKFLTPKNPQTVLLSFDLYNSAGERVANTVYENVEINASTTLPSNVFIMKSPAHLVPDTYTWKAGIFKPEWAGTIRWYESVMSFSVVATSSKSFGNNPTTATYGGVWSRFSSLNAGGTNYISAQFYNGRIYSRVNVGFYLYDAETGNVVQKKLIKDVWFEPLSIYYQGMTTTPLAKGSYYWSIGLSSIDDDRMYHWYHNVHSFQVR